MDNKNIIIKVDIDLEDNTVFISKEYLTGCKYKFNNKKELLEWVEFYLDIYHEEEFLNNGKEVKS